MNKNRYADARPLLKELGILTVYQLNLYQILTFMFKLKNEMTPKVFRDQFSFINHRYPTRYSINNYQIPQNLLRKTDFSITCRGPRIWNNLLSSDLKTVTSINLFKNSIKRILLNLVNEKEYFWFFFCKFLYFYILTMLLLFCF